MIQKFLCSALLAATTFASVYASAYTYAPQYAPWFINVAGGGSAFIGSPKGCEDLFGRVQPTLQVSLGKWHTPTVGNRLVFQGFQWKSGALQSQNYRHYHADLLWNVTPSLDRFDIIPLVGVGIIDNRTADCRPFALNYGVQGRYRLTDYLHVTAELSNATTFKNADGLGAARQLGDHHLSLTAGVAWTFGRKVSGKKVADSAPTMQQSECLAAYTYEPHSNYPVNDYSGLNSLRRRLHEDKNAHRNSDKKASLSSESAPSSLAWDSIHIEESDYLGAPIFFFFELGTSNLVDASQLVNLNEIARIAIKYGLKIDVVGAADSQTGTEQINNNLGVARAQYIAEYLTAQGVLAENITTHSHGGISTYTPTPANRNATVSLYLP
jgi:outer membrane protein OmpA-like peptidoglycan-associated protein